MDGLLTLKMGQFRFGPEGHIIRFGSHKTIIIIVTLIVI
jgi:hypothetical protein